MRSDLPIAAVLIALAALAACGGHDAVVDGGSDAGVPDAIVGVPDGGSTFTIAPPEPPRMLPCPDGWTARPLDAEPDVVACIPYASTEPDACGPFEAHFLGEAGCVGVGSACPPDGWPIDVPPDASFVDPAAPAGGDGSTTAPFTLVADALAAADDGAVIALRVGIHASSAQHHIQKSVRIVGACASETHLVVRSAGVGVRISGDVTVQLENLGLQSTRSDALQVEAGATAALSETVVFGTQGYGVHAQGGTVTGRSILIRDIESVSGTGMRVSNAGMVEVERIAIRTTSDHALATANGTIRITDLVVDQRSSVGGLGIRLIDSDATFVRVGVYGATEVGIYVVDTSATMRDVHVRGTVQPKELIGAVSVGLLGNTISTIDRLVAEENAIEVLSVIDGAELLLRDAVVSDTSPDVMGRFGRGLDVRGGTAALERVVFSKQAEIAVVVSAGAGLSASDLSIVDTRSDISNGGFGRALHAQEGATVTLARSRLARNREATIIASGAGTTITLEDAVVTDTQPRICVTTTCPGAGAGIGIAAIEEAYVSATRFEISRHALTGVQLANGGTMDLDTGLIADNPVGANIQTEPFDVSRLATEVTYRNNGQNLDASRLTVPSAPTGL